MGKKTFTRIAAAGIAVAATVGIGGTAVAGAPAGAGKPAGIQCMQNGIGTLQDAGLLPAVAKGGLPVADAVDLGVSVRPGKEGDFAELPDVLPLSVVLADHRAGDDSILVYPWC